MNDRTRFGERRGNTTGAPEICSSFRAPAASHGGQSGQAGNSRNETKARLNTAAAAFVVLATMSLATPSGARAAEVPDGSIFGFSEPTDIGKPGDRSFGSEFTNNSGKGAGAYSASSLKNRLSVTFAEGWEASVAAFGSHHHIRHAPDLQDNHRVGFDGGSLEIARRLLPRSAGAPVAVTLISELYAGANDPGSGFSGRNLSLETRLAIDTVLIPGRLYGAVNLLYNIAAQDEGGRAFRQASSGYGASAAATWQINPWLFAGVETRLDVTHDGAFFGKKHGWAVFAGPTAAIRLGEGVMLNAVWTPQIRGGGHGAHRGRDLNAHARNLARVALSLDF